MKKFIFTLTLIVSGNAFAACEYETQMRDYSRDLCRDYTTLTQALAVGSAIVSKVFFPIGMVSAVAPAASFSIHENQCRILKEREENLRLCLVNHHAEVNRRLQAERDAITETKRRADALTAINARYDGLEAEARRNHQAQVRAVGERFRQEGRSLRDAQVRADLRREIQALDLLLATELNRLSEERSNAARAV